MTFKEYVVRNNETGQERTFKTMTEATAFQEACVFKYGIDAEVL